jgi:hypothetical protein
LCIRKRGTISYLTYVYDLDFVFQKERNCIIYTVWLWSRLCVSEIGNCIIPTVCLVSKLCLKVGICIIPAWSELFNKEKEKAIVFLYELQKWRKLHNIWSLSFGWWVLFVKNPRLIVKWHIPWHNVKTCLYCMKTNPQKICYSK